MKVEEADMNDERDKEEDRDGKVRGKGRKAGCD